MPLYHSSLIITVSFMESKLQETSFPSGPAHCRVQAKVEILNKSTGGVPWRDYLGS